MLRRNIAVGIMTASILAIAGVSVWAEGDENNSAALAKALPEASVTLDQGLKVSWHTGNPISGKYEIEDGVLQLSIYTMNGDLNGNVFSEVIVDHKAGTIKKTGKITDADDLKHTKEQRAAMLKADVPLDQAVAKAVKSNEGYRAVSVTPMLTSGSPVATITLMKGAEVKKVTEKLDGPSPPKRID